MTVKQKEIINQKGIVNGQELKQELLAANRDIICLI